MSEERWEPEDEDLITLIDEDGKESEFYIGDVLTVGDRRYAVLVPVDESGEQPADLLTAVPFRIERDDDGEDALVEIEDEEEFDLVDAAWDERWNDEDDEEDEDSDDEEDEP